MKADDLWDIDTPIGMCHALRWLEQEVDNVQHNGMWVPHMGVMYRIDHTAKIASANAWTSYDPIDRVFREMGWVVQRRFNA